MTMLAWTIYLSLIGASAVTVTPGKNPVVSSTKMSGMLYRLQKRMKRVPLRAAPMSICPDDTAELLLIYGKN